MPNLFDGSIARSAVGPFVQGGAAWTSAEATAFNSLGGQIGSISGNSRTGWTAGGGVEWMFIPHWSAFIEYNYMGFGSITEVPTTTGNLAASPAAVKLDLQTAVIGINYKF